MTIDSLTGPKGAAEIEPYVTIDIENCVIYSDQSKNKDQCDVQRSLGNEKDNVKVWLN